MERIMNKAYKKMSLKRKICLSIKRPISHPEIEMTRGQHQGILLRNHRIVSTKKRSQKFSERKQSQISRVRNQIGLTTQHWKTWETCFHYCEGKLSI